MEADVRWCPHCKLRGEKKRLRHFQINDNQAALLCENDKCIDIGEMTSSSLIVQRKSSEIPNSKRKKRPLVAVSSSTPKMPTKSLHLTQSSTAPHPKADDTPTTPAVPSSSPRLLTVCDKDSECLLSNTVSSLTMPQVVLWRNKNSLCWLDACMCVLVSCHSLRTCLSQLPGNSLTRKLCMVFAGAQKRPKINGSGMTSTKSNLRSSVDACTYGHCTSTLDAGVLFHSALAEEGGSSDESCCKENTAPVAIKTLKENTHCQEAVRMTRCSATSHNPQDNYLPQDSELPTQDCLKEQTVRSLDSLEKVRDEVFRRLHPVLRYEAGQEESPVLALPLLLRLDGCIQEHFMSRYRWEFYCYACGHTEVNFNKKTMPTFTRVPVDFNMSAPVMLRRCPQCDSLNQEDHLVFHSLPACVVIHFQEGLRDGDIARHRSFIQGGDTYMLSAVVLYRRNPSHFVTLIVDQETNHWLPYDDVLPSPFTWQSQTPLIPADEIHIMMWERVKTPCTACVEMHANITAILDRPVGASQTRIPGSSNSSVSEASPATLRNENSIRSSKSASQPLSHRENKHERYIVGRRNSISSTKASDKNGGVVGSVSSPRIQETVAEVTTEIEYGNGVAVASYPCTEVSKEAPQVAGSGLSTQSHFSGFKAGESIKKPVCSDKSNAATSERNEPLLPKLKARTQLQMQNIATKPVPKPQMAERTFISKVTSRRKCRKDNNDQSTVTKSNTSSILAKIPEQLLKFSGMGGVTSCSKIGSVTQGSRICSVTSGSKMCNVASGSKTDSVTSSSRTNSVVSGSKAGNVTPYSRMNSMSTNREEVFTNASVINGIPKKQIAISQSQVDLNRKVARPTLLGSQPRAPVKRVKFQPYRFGPNTQQEERERLEVSDNVHSKSILSSWQKRVGMFSSATVPRKRARQDSTGESGSLDLTKHAGPPCSSVSSPSACSDISSVSDNQSFASGRDDLTATIDELCKVLDVSSEYTPSVSPRFSSPSQDMFFSRLLEEAVQVGPEDTVNDASCSLENRKNAPPDTVTSSEISAMSSNAHLQSISVLPAQFHDDALPSCESFQPAALSSANLLEGILPSVDGTCPGLVPASFTVPSEVPTKPVESYPKMSPSTASMQPVVDPVARQQEPHQPIQCLDGAMTHVTPLNDHMSGASGFGLSDPTTGGSHITAFCSVSNEGSSETVKDIDDFIDLQLFDNIPEDVDEMQCEWKDNFVDLFAQ